MNRTRTLEEQQPAAGSTRAHGRFGVLARAPEVPPELARSWADECDEWFGPGRVPLARAPGKSGLARIETPLGSLVAKLERPAGWKRGLSALGARRWRSLRAYQRAQALLAHGLETPEPVCVLACSRAARPRAILLTRLVEGLGPWELLRHQGDVPTLARTLAHALVRLHGAGFRHRDLKASNLLLRPGSAGHELVWTDLDGLGMPGPVSLALRARDLSRLGLSFESADARAAGVRAEHWPELVRTYLSAQLGRPPTTDELDLLLGRTRRWTERAIRRHLARGRPIG